MDIVGALNAVLEYNKEMCREMFLANKQEDRDKLFAKGEAAREIMVRLIKTLPSRQEKEMGEMLAKRLESLYELLFFDRAFMEGDD